MSGREDGGAAFPLHPTFTEAGQIAIPGQPGLSVRDYFAAAALTALVGRQDGEPSTGCNEGVYRGIAMRAYEFADAMLRARQPREGGPGNG